MHVTIDDVCTHGVMVTMASISTRLRQAITRSLTPSNLANSPQIFSTYASGCRLKPDVCFLKVFHIRVSAKICIAL